MTADRIKKLAAQGPAETRLFFDRTPDAETLARAIVAISNVGGGHIVVGMAGDGKVTGISKGTVKNTIAAAGRLYTGNPRLTVKAVSIDHKSVVLITVDVVPDVVRLKDVPLTRVQSRRVSGGTTHPPTADTDTAETDGDATAPPQDDAADDMQDNPESGEDFPLYSATHLERTFGEKNETPCFDVDRLANSFFNLLRQCSANADNVCFLGVFGEWGRGKSFFIRRLEKKVAESEYAGQFDFVDFNAWKYQETPGVWAHLIHTLRRHKSAFWRFMTDLSWQSAAVVICVIGLLAISAAAAVLAIEDWNNPDNKDSATSILTAALSLIAAGAGYFGLLRQAAAKKRQGYEAGAFLGAQHQSEVELERTLRRWNMMHWFRRNVDKDRKVVLVVEDIDRCSGERMLATLEALKLIMENPEVARRMVVIVTLDINRLNMAYLGRSGEMSVSNYAAEQINKLFLSAIALPPLDIPDMHDYIEALAGYPLMPGRNSAVIYPAMREDVDSNVEPQPDETGNNRGEEDALFVIDGLDEEMTVRTLGTLLAEKLRENGSSRLTPRHVKILFYRLMLANNLYSDLDEPISHARLSELVDMSLWPAHAQSCRSRILRMAAPYVIV